jgi:hypothetical protein
MSWHWQERSRNKQGCQIAQEGKKLAQTSEVSKINSGAERRRQFSQVYLLLGCWLGVFNADLLISVYIAVQI